MALQFWPVGDWFYVCCSVGLVIYFVFFALVHLSALYMRCERRARGSLCHVDHPHPPLLSSCRLYKDVGKDLGDDEYPPVSILKVIESTLHHTANADGATHARLHAIIATVDAHAAVYVAP